MAVQIREEKISFIPIKLTDLADGYALPCEVYAKDRGIIKFLFAENTLINEVTKQILVSQGISELFIKPNDKAVFNDYLSFTKSMAVRKDDKVLMKNYSSYKSQQFPVDRYIISLQSSERLNIGILKYPSYGVLALAEEKPPSAVVKEINQLGADIVIARKHIAKYLRHIEEIASQEQNKHLSDIILREKMRVALSRFFEDLGSETKFKELLITAYPVFEYLKERKKEFRRLLLTGLNDTYFEVHLCNTAILSSVIGFGYGFGVTEVLKLFIGALLHDIGKLTFNQEIVDRQGKLNSYEIALLKTHPQAGFKLLEPFKPLLSKQIFDIVLQHHETCDGKGYPQGLEGSQISQYAKIVAVADAFDALTHPRPFREAVKPFGAFSVMKAEIAKYDRLALKILIESFE